MLAFTRSSVVGMVYQCSLLLSYSCTSVFNVTRDTKKHDVTQDEEILVPLNRTIPFRSDIHAPEYIWTYPLHITLSTVSRECADVNATTNSAECEARNSIDDESQCVAQTNVVYDARAGKESVEVKCCQSEEVWTGHTINGGKRNRSLRSLTFQLEAEAVDMTLFTPSLSGEKTFKCPLPLLSSSSSDQYYLALSIRCDPDVDKCGSLGFYRGVKDFLVKTIEQEEHPVVQERKVMLTKYVEQCQEPVYPWKMVAGVSSGVALFLVFTYFLKLCMDCCNCNNKIKAMYKHKILTEC